MIEFIGRFHPLIVHLPIGMFCLAIVLKLLNFKGKNDSISNVLPIILILTFATAIFSCFTGYTLFNSNTYENSSVEKHMWAAFGLTGLLGLLIVSKNYKLLHNLIWGFAFVFLILTGHLGGGLTHGENYLSPKPEKDVKKVENIETALVYNDLIEPIFAKNCYSCHSEQKQKGLLRLDSKSFILAGGKHKNALIPRNPDNSLIYKRLLLDQNQEEHMPPKGKPQLTRDEIKLINWWIGQGAPFDKKVNQLTRTKEIAELLNNYKNEQKSEQSENVKPANEIDIQKMRDLGAAITSISQNSNFLSVNLNGSIKVNNNTIRLLSKLKPQLIQLNASYCQIDDLGLAAISELENLTHLNLSHTSISDESFSNINKLKKLRVLNLSFTNVTEIGILNLKDLKNLESIYLFNSKINKSSWSKLQSHLPNTKLDSGGYLVPTLATDTLQLKPSI